MNIHTKSMSRTVARPIRPACVYESFVFSPLVETQLWTDPLARDYLYREVRQGSLSPIYRQGEEWCVIVIHLVLPTARYCLSLPLNFLHFMVELFHWLIGEIAFFLGYRSAQSFGKLHCRSTFSVESLRWDRIHQIRSDIHWYLQYGHLSSLSLQFTQRQWMRHPVREQPTSAFTRLLRRWTTGK